MLLVFQRLFVEALLHVLLLPFWWYTVGVTRWVKKLFSWFRLGNEYLVPLLWWGHLFVPMFGQVDRQGRLVSFFIRIVNAIVRTFALGVWATILFGAFLVWCSLPIMVLYLFGSAFFMPKPSV
jgi:hypothetical protein